MNYMEQVQLDTFLTLLAGKLPSEIYEDYINHPDIGVNKPMIDFGAGSGMPAQYSMTNILPEGTGLACLDISDRFTGPGKQKSQGYPLTW